MNLNVQQSHDPEIPNDVVCSIGSGQVLYYLISHKGGAHFACLD